MDYMIKCDSLSQLRYKTMQQIPEFVRTDDKKPHVIGAQNNNGKCVFDCVPCAGSIPGGMSWPMVVSLGIKLIQIFMNRQLVVIMDTHICTSNKRLF